MSITLFQAVESKDVDLLATLLNDGGDPNALDSRQAGWTLLKAAIDTIADGADLDMIVLLLRAGANVNNAGTVGNSSPLVVAIYNRNYEIARLLIAAGADVNRRDDEGDFPLLLSVQQSSFALINLLVRCGASATINESGGAGGMTPLGIAIGRADFNLTQLLLRLGADPWRPDSDSLLPLGYLPEDTGANAESVAAIADLFKQLRQG